MTKVILVTGGSGYIGSQLIRDLAVDTDFNDYVIRIYDNLYRGNYHVLMDLPKSGCYEFIEGDILDRLTLADAMKDVWAVVHLAAIVKTPVSFDNPQLTEQVNHWGTAMVVDQSVEASVERFIYACSSSVYGPGGPFFEDDPCGPVGPYSSSKLKGEQVVMGAGQDRGLHVTSLRMGTSFGYSPGVRFEAFTNHLSYLAGIGKSLIVHGDGRQKRPLIHIRDTSNALLFCLKEDSTKGQTLNMVMGNYSVLDVVNIIRQVVPDIPVRYTDQDVLTALSFEADGGRLEELGFKTNYSIESGISEIIQRLSPLGCNTYSGFGF
jgi:nucleoside-diphosphate-sugar epimerase